MAKKKTTARRTRQSALAGNAAYPHRSGSACSTSKATSVSPSNASSPSPQPQDPILRRRKGTPVRSPAQGDQTKGIVFAFRIQNDPDLSMAVDILSYDQQDGPEQDPTPALSTADPLSATAEPATIAVTSLAATPPSQVTLTSPVGSELMESRPEPVSSPLVSPSDPLTLPSSQLRMAGEQWSSDPTSYLSNNVVDLTRNLLILHARKPALAQSSWPSLSSSSSSSSPSASRKDSWTDQADTAFHPYPPRRQSSSFSSQPSTPALSVSGSLSSSSSSSQSSSPASSPSSPSSFHSPPVSASSSKEELCSLESLPSPLGQMGSQSSRILNVRGLGARGRRMQVILVA